jgi:hypothetical protein
MSKSQKNQGFLATFRIDEELWGKFKDVAKNKQTNASALIIQYIQNTVGGDAIPQNIDNPTTLSIHDIDNRIDEKIRQSIQDINTPSIQNIEDMIDARIGGSIADGDIKSAIAHSYKSSINQFNGHLEELQQQIAELKTQVQELKSSPSAAPLISPSADIENLLGIGDILAGSPYDLNYLNVYIGDRLSEHKSQIEAALRIKLNLADPKYICREFNKIIRGLGYEIKNKQINKVETYWIETNNDKVPK